MTIPLGWFELRGATQALAWFCLLNVGASAVVALLHRRLASRARAQAATLWFGLRIFPTVCATAFVALFFIPSFWRYEPRDTVEGIDLILVAGTTLTAMAVLAAGVRAVSGWRSVRRRIRQWMRTARPLQVAEPSLRAFEIDGDAPVFVLAGVWRPRLFVARKLVAALTEDELRVSIAHEVGHARSWDNLKRLVMRSAPDVLSGASALGTVERQWAAAAERRADMLATGNNAGARYALASALVKVAKLTPPAAPSLEPVSTLVTTSDVTARVQLLLDDRAVVGPPGTVRPIHWIAAATIAAAGAAAYEPMLRAVHDATEILIRSLP